MTTTVYYDVTSFFTLSADMKQIGYCENDTQPPYNVIVNKAKHPEPKMIIYFVG